uniref:Secreted protein n=1 Tax=Heterorhabditis bacteriophora TaxID=37862 RepID=A0A1I7W7S4_HETBA
MEDILLSLLYITLHHGSRVYACRQRDSCDAQPLAIIHLLPTHYGLTDSRLLFDILLSSGSKYLRFIMNSCQNDNYTVNKDRIGTASVKQD